MRDVTQAKRVVGVALAEVERLVGVESQALSCQDVVQAAEGLMVSEPQSLLVRVVGHCQQLLGVKELQGLVPAMNRVRSGREGEGGKGGGGIVATLNQW
jgi:hypothetical protein